MRFASVAVFASFLIAGSLLYGCLDEGHFDVEHMIDCGANWQCFQAAMAQGQDANVTYSLSQGDGFVTGVAKTTKSNAYPDKAYVWLSVTDAKIPSDADFAQQLIFVAVKPIMQNSDMYCFVPKADASSFTVQVFNDPLSLTTYDCAGKLTTILRKFYG